MSNCDELHDILLLIAVILLILHFMKPKEQEGMEINPRAHARQIRGLDTPSVESTQAMASSMIDPYAKLSALGDYVDKYAGFYS